MTAPLSIWFVDDLSENRKTWLNSFPEVLRLSHDFQTYASLDLLFSAFKQTIPDILFLDFFIAEKHGHEVLDYFAPQPERPLLIAHSSSLRANQALIKAGADLCFEKLKGVEKTPAIVAQIRSEEDLEALLALKGHKQPPSLRHSKAPQNPLG